MLVVETQNFRKYPSVGQKGEKDRNIGILDFIKEKMEVFQTHAFEALNTNTQLAHNARWQKG